MQLVAFLMSEALLQGLTAKTEAGVHVLLQYPRGFGAV